MKRIAASALNTCICVVLAVLDIVFALERGLSSDAWLLITLAGLCLVIYIAGMINLNGTVRFIWKFSMKLYKNSVSINIPIEAEARKIFKKRLPYILLTANIFLVLLLFVILFK